MVYYNNPYKRILRAFIRAIKVFFSSLVSKSVLITIICFLIILLFINENHVEATTTIQPTEDIYQEILDYQLKQQDELILFSYYPFLENSDFWNNQLKPMYDNFKQTGRDVYVSFGRDYGKAVVDVSPYEDRNTPNYSTGSYKSQVTGISYDIQYRRTYSPSYYYIEFDFNTNVGSVTLTQRQRCTTLLST